MDRKIYYAVKRWMERIESNVNVVWVFWNDGLNEGIPSSDPDYLPSFVAEYQRGSKVSAWNAFRRIRAMVGAEEFDGRILAAVRKSDKPWWLDEVVGRYACLQDETLYIDWGDKGIITIRWNSFMDRYVDMKKVMAVARRIRRFTDVPIYSSYGLLNV